MAKLASAEVVSIPYWDMTPPPVRHREPPKPLRFDHDRPLRVGFIGAQNAVNMVNMNRFLARFQRWVRLYNAPVRVVVAGNVCNGLEGDYAFVEKLGHVARIEDFYNDVDAIVAPLEFSTGIKIKVGEALAWDKPVVGTQNGFDGYRVWHPTQSLPSVEAVCDQLVGLSMNEMPWEELVLDARRAARAARAAQEHGFGRLKAWLRGRASRIIVVTARPLWRRDTLLDEYLAHVVEYLSHLGKIIVITTDPGAIEASRVYAQADYVHLPEAQIPEAVRKLNDVSTVMALVLGPYAPKGVETAAPPGALVWRLDLGGRGGGALASAGRLIGIANAPTLAVSMLRYAPVSGVTALDDSKVVILAPEAADEWEEAVVDYVVASANARALTSEIARAPAEFETSPQAFAAIARSPARRVVLVGRPEWFEYVAQAARYRQQSCMLASRELVAPSAIDADGESLTDAIDKFLEGRQSAIAPAGPDSGWERVWAVVDQVRNGRGRVS